MRNREESEIVISARTILYTTFSRNPKYDRHIKWKLLSAKSEWFGRQNASINIPTSENISEPFLKSWYSRTPVSRPSCLKTFILLHISEGCTVRKKTTRTGRYKVEPEDSRANLFLFHYAALQVGKKVLSGARNFPYGFLRFVFLARIRLIKISLSFSIAAHDSENNALGSIRKYYPHHIIFCITAKQRNLVSFHGNLILWREYKVAGEREREREGHFSQNFSLDPAKTSECSYFAMQGWYISVLSSS